jgi:hypothetical protein
MAELILAQSLLEETHTTAEYLQWVKSIISRVQGEPDDLKRIRLQLDPAKELVLSHWSDGVDLLFGGGDQVSIRLRVGNQSYDATACRLP